ncbi:MAG: DUF3298 domain-containing protein [Prevotella sp.]|nr:DUF3298 domain-containing protein [Prevotella sp.]
MRHIFMTLLLIFAAINAMADNTVPVSSVDYEKEQQYGSSRVSVEFPLGENSPLRRAIIDYILETCKTINSGVKVKQPSNICDKVAFEKYLEKYTTVVCKFCAEDQHDYALSFEDDVESYKVVWFSNLFISKVADTDKYVSYAAYHGEFIGGAHDQRGSGAITLCKADGKRIDSIFKEDVEEKMQPLLWKYLIASEEPDNPDEFRSEINQFLEANYGIRDFLHLGIPFLAPDGVHILYQPLEICFWPGEPEIVIPFGDAKPFLTEEVLKLVF